MRIDQSLPTGCSAPMSFIEEYKIELLSRRVNNVVILVRVIGTTDILRQGDHNIVIDVLPF
jgi:hypothetical protein